MPDSVVALRQLGAEGVADEGIPFSGIRFADRDSSVAARFPGLTGIGIRRTVLHEKMMNAAASLGVKFRWESPVTSLQSDAVKLACGDVVTARWIVGADGGRSRVRKWIGLDMPGRQSTRFAFRSHYRVAPWSGFVEVHWGESGQAYVTPVSQNEVCVVVMSRQPNWRLHDALMEFPELSRKLSQGTVASSERGAVSLMHRLNRVYRNNIALIGDASGGVDAITGEGLSLSFRQAVVLADAMALSNLSKYQSAHRRLSWRSTFMARLILLLDGRTRLRQRTLRTFAANPELFARITAIHVGETSPAHFAATGALLGWRFLEA